MRILLAEPQGIFRDSVRSVLRAVTDSFEGATPIVVEASTGMEAARAAAQPPPDIALVSASLPPDGGLQAAAAISRAAPNCRIVLVADHRDEATLVRGVRAGVTGFVAKAGPLSELIAAIAAAHRGCGYVPPGMVEGLLRRAAGQVREVDGPVGRVERLTERERQVLAGLIGGDGNGQLARRLGISPQTARTHVQHILTKLGVHSRLEAAALGRTSGAIEPMSMEFVS